MQTYCNARPLDLRSGLERPPTVLTRLWKDEHDGLHRIYKSAHNVAPQFRLPDLLSACVSLSAGPDEDHAQLSEYLTRTLILRDPATARRSCAIWHRQFDLLMQAHRAPWNCFPNPRFDLEHLTTACVALAMQRCDGEQEILRQARVNLIERMHAGGLSY